MTARGLVERVTSPGFTPSVRDVGPLFELLAGADDDLGKHVERALARLGDRAVVEATVRFDAAAPPLRARLCALVGRLAADGRAEALGPWLAERTSDPDAKTRRRALRALGRIRGPGAEATLLSALAASRDAADVRAAAQALGSAGSERALPGLDAVVARDAETGRVLREARAKLERVGLRREPSAVDLDRALPGEVSVLLHVRVGLEPVLSEELGRGAAARAAGRGRLEVRHRGPLRELFRARTFLHLGFPLPSEPVGSDGAAAAVARALASEAAWELLRGLTVGPVRYRLEWAGGGRRRGQTQLVADAVRALRPALVNDPAEAPWEVVVSEREGRGGPRVHVELWPRGLTDPRFEYRRRTVPASSHPTVAAALAHVGGVERGDVVWDPFAGAGVELVERALLGPYSRLIGSDVDAAALAAARENVAAARIARCELVLGDARTVRLPARPTLILTNPPFGRRVLAREAIAPLLDATLARAASLLEEGGRLVWISPQPAATRDGARRHGLEVALCREVDLGGFTGELQLLRRPSGRGTRGRRA